MKPFDIHQKGNPRLALFYPIAGCMLLVLIIVLGWRQLAEFNQYKDREELQAQRRIIQPGPRGDIFDRNGKLLVGNRPRFSAVIFPDELSKLRREFRREYIRRVRAIRKAREETGEHIPIDVNQLIWESRSAIVQNYLDEINSIMGWDRTLTVSQLQRHFSQELLLPLTLVQDLDHDAYAKLIEQLPVNSPVQIYTDSARYYPYGSSAAHVLGYVTSTYLDAEEEKLPGDELTTFSFKGKEGKTGLERYFNESLKGQSGGEIYRVDPSGFQHELLESREPQKGNNLVISLDIDLQQMAEVAMGQKIGAAVAIKIDTGEVLVLASKPDYDLNRLSPFIPTSTYQEITENGAWLNRATQGLYPPGSTFKLITSIASLRQGIIEPDTVIHSPKYFRVGRRLFPCHSPYGFGDITLTKAIAVSSNTFYYNTGIQTGIDNIAEEAKRFGLDQQIELEIPFMARRMIVPTKEWKKQDGRGGWVPGDTANVSIGQGFLLTTPLHMACFTASLGRGETHTKPTLVRVLDSESGAPATDHGADLIGLSNEDLQAVYQGMIDAVNGGTAKYTQLPYLQVGGKTGTAQVKKDGKDLTLAWFVGMAPMENPEVAVAICIEGTDSGDNYHGGSTAAPIARVIFDGYFRDRITQIANRP